MPEGGRWRPARAWAFGAESADQPAAKRWPAEAIRAKGRLQRPHRMAGLCGHAGDLLLFDKAGMPDSGLDRPRTLDAEQGFWVAVYLFAVAASGCWLHWCGLGVLQLMLLFQGSTGLTEAISSRKYPKCAGEELEGGSGVPCARSAARCCVGERMGFMAAGVGTPHVGPTAPRTAAPCQVQALPVDDVALDSLAPTQVTEAFLRGSIGVECMLRRF